jgi:hypothetical protein
LRSRNIEGIRSGSEEAELILRCILPPLVERASEEESWLPLEFAAEIRVLDELRAEPREKSDDWNDAALDVALSSMGEKEYGTCTNIADEVV